MKKLAIALPLAAGLVGASWAGTTFVNGSETREAYDELVRQLDKSLGLKVETLSYEGGFLASQAVTVIKTSDAPDAEVVARLHHRIEHSPVGIGENVSVRAGRIVTTLDIEELISDEVAELMEGFGDAAPVTLVSNIGYDGASENELTVAAYSIQSDSGTSIESSPAIWRFEIDADERFKGAGEWQGATLTLAPNDSMPASGVMTIAGFTDQFDYRKLGAALYDGEYRLELPEITFAMPDMGLDMALRQLDMRSTSRVADERVANDFKLAIRDIEVPIPLQSAELGVSLAGLDVAGLEAAQHSARRQQASSLSDQSEEDLQRAALEHAAAMTSIVVPGSKLGYEIALGNAGGDARTAIEIEFDGDGSPTGKQHLYSEGATVADLAGALKVSLSFRADADAIAMTPLPMMLDTASFSPWLVVDDEGYKSDIRLDDMTVMVNGDAIPLEMLAGDMLPAPLNLHQLQKR